MGYSKSSARITLDAYIKEIAIRVKDASKERVISTEMKQMIYSAAVIECSATLECYIEDVLSQWIVKAENLQITADKLPKPLLLYLLGKSFSSPVAALIASHDEEKFISLLQGINISQFECSATVNSRMIRSVAVKDKKYPSPKNLKNIFRRFGIKNIHQDITRVLRKDSELLLRSFMDVRASVAHSYPTATIFSERDILSYLTNAGTIVRALDRILYKHIAACHGTACWS